MVSSLLTRLSASLAAISLCGGLAFLSGCCGDKCEEHHACSECSEVEVSSGEAEEPVNVEYRPSERREFETGVVRESEPSFSVETFRTWTEPRLRDRLIEIRREKTLYPDRVTVLEREESFINRELSSRGANVNVDVGERGRTFESRRDMSVEERGINVRQFGEAPAKRAETGTAKSSTTVESRSIETNAQEKKLGSQPAAEVKSSEMKSEVKTETPAPQESKANVDVNAQPQAPEMKSDTGAIKSESNAPDTAEIKSSDVNSQPSSEQPAAEKNAEVSAPPSESKSSGEVSAPPPAQPQSTEMKKADSGVATSQTETKTEESVKTNTEKSEVKPSSDQGKSESDQQPTGY